MVSVKEGDHEMVTLYGKDIAALIILCVSLYSIPLNMGILLKMVTAKVSFIGVCGNITVAVFTRKLPTMNNPFGRLLASQATGEAILCGSFLFFYFPMMFFDSEWMFSHSGTAGFIQLICYDICVWSHFFISINRFVAICLPLHYDTVFSQRNTWIMIAFTWTVAITFETFVHYIPVFGDSCLLIFSPALWAYLFENNQDCAVVSFYVDFYKDIGFVILIGIIDIVTIYHVHRTNKVLVAVSTAQKTRRDREISFLKQAILQMVVFIIELNTYFIWCEKFIDNRWVFWFMTSFAWCTVHTTDGIIILLFNREFRKLITSPLRKLYSIAAKESKEQLTGTTPGNANVMSSVSHGYC